jgi:hypothetical protein
VRRAGAEVVPSLGAHAGPRGPPRREAAGAWALESLWVLGAQHHACWGGPFAGTNRAGSEGNARCSTMTRTPRGAVTGQVCQHPPAASTPRAGEDIQREPPAQQPGPIQSRRALLRPLHPRSQGRALLLQPRLRPRLREHSTPRWNPQFQQQCRIRGEDGWHFGMVFPKSSG